MSHGAFVSEGRVLQLTSGRKGDGDGWINRLFVLCNILGDIYRLSTELYLDLVFEFELGPGSRGQARPGGGTGHSV